MDFQVRIDAKDVKISASQMYRLAATSPECISEMRSICSRKAAEASAAASAAAHDPMREAFASDVHTGVPKALTVGVVFPTFKGADNVNKAHGVLHW